MTGLPNGVQTPRDYSYDIARQIIADLPVLATSPDMATIGDMLALAAKRGYITGYSEGFARAGQSASFVGVL